MNQLEVDALALFQNQCTLIPGNGFGTYNLIAFTITKPKSNRITTTFPGTVQHFMMAVIVRRKMARKMLVEVVADCLPMTMLCDCQPDLICLYCLNLANELVNNLWTQGFEIRRKDEV